MPAYITGLGACLPNKPVHNEKIEAILGMVGNMPSPVKDVILDRNGINWRYYALDPETGRPTHTNAQLTVEAIRALAETTGLEWPQIELLACGTSSPDQAIPGHASMVHGLLGCPPCEIVSTAGVCCSGMTAMKYAYTSVLAGTAATAVATGSELASSALSAVQFEPQVAAAAATGDPYVNFSQEFLRFMLSDGAGAVLIESRPRPQTPALRIDWLDIRSFANELETCMYSGAVKLPDGSLSGWRAEEKGLAEALKKGYFNLSQDVNLLGENIVKVGSRFFTETCAAHQLKPEEIDWLVIHLSSMFFQQPIYEEMARLGYQLPLERWYTNLKYKGNTGAASIYIMLEELAKSGKLKPGQRILCAVPESARFTFAGMHLTVEQA